MSEYVAASIGGANNGIFENALSEWSSQFNYGQYYFQFKDDNQNMMYDVGEIYAVSLENGFGPGYLKSSILKSSLEISSCFLKK